jgi:hypothetical protein
MKRLFVVGDSISCYYGRHLEPMLRGFFEYDRKGHKGKLEGLDDGTDGQNGGDSRMVRTYLTEMAKRWSADRPDYLLLNCGSHDIKKDLINGEHQVPIEEYERNLRYICSLILGLGIKIVWVRSTPIIEPSPDAIPRELHTIRSNADIAFYDRIAIAVMKEHEIPMIDLHGFTSNLEGDLYFDHHCHFNEVTAAKQAAFIAGYMRGLCRLPANPRS